ncbi:T6SS effector amidase Tae4 family protein [Epilithonimonas tenax]|uniref:T6SS effector amidase Tae4 family protein n=1 Tax=Epilithonimonas tenax TaxID=191577 RepID=UPI0009FDCFF9|nr:T6SS effector amidase Tae4 family protein [Epilithonimonas tenax]
MTFIFFDNEMFGSRLYSSIPADLFESVPARDGADHKTFAVGHHEATNNLEGEMCFPVFDCKNGMDEAHCDGCTKCVFQICFTGGGGPTGGNRDTDPGFPGNPTGNEDTGGTNGGHTDPNIPWYLQNPEIDIFSKSPAVQSVFQSLTDYGIVLHVSQVNYLQENNTIAQRFRTYLASDNSLVKSQNANMGINFFIDNPDTTWEQFYNWFLTPSEGKDWNYDANFWDDPNLTFPAQSLPSWSAFSSAYPNQTSAQMYGVVGGAVAQAQIDYPVETQNGCALKVSRALNYSGVIIPNIPGKTLKGADNKNYFLNAKSLNAWMRKTFGVSPSNPRHINITKLQGGINGKNFPNLIKNKKGIFSMVSPPNSTWASGHADILYSNGTCKAGCHFFDGDILYGYANKNSSIS